MFGAEHCSALNEGEKMPLFHAPLKAQGYQHWQEI